MAKKEQLTPIENGFFGNKDDNKVYPLDRTWKNSIVVRQSQSVDTGMGEYVELPSSVKLMPYDKSMYERLVKTGGFKGLNIEILHEPTI